MSEIVKLSKAKKTTTRKTASRKKTSTKKPVIDAPKPASGSNTLPKIPLRSLENKTVTLKGTIYRIVFQNPENQYFVALVRPESKCSSNEEFFFGFKEEVISITGHSFGFSLFPGGTFLFSGTVKRNPKHGMQIESNWVEPSFPSEKNAFINYLSNTLDHIGLNKATKLVEHLGIEGTVEALDDDHERIIEILGESAAIRESLKSWKSARQGMFVCTTLMNYGMSAKLATTTWEIFGPKAIEIVKTNPYLFIDRVPGIGFKKADDLAERVGIAPDSDIRRMALIEYVISRMVFERGHTVFPRHEVVQKSHELTEKNQLSINVIEKTLDQLIDAHRIMAVDETRISEAKTWYSEQSIAYSLVRLWKHGKRFALPQKEIERLIGAFEEKTGVSFDERQIQALVMALQEPVSIITGGPGVGKTTIIRCLIESLKRLGIEKILLTAPTGRAAKRMQESTQYPASTIHRALGWKQGKSPNHDRGNPLECDVMIVDEVSMVDVFAAKNLLNALKDHTKVIFVGDPDQLPSIGPGMVLKNLIDSRIIPCTRLNRIFRQGEGSAITRAAHAINTGKPPHFVQTLDAEFVFLNAPERTNPDEWVIQTIERNILPELERQGFDPVTDIQILSPIKKGPSGVIALAEMMQRKYNGFAAPENSCVVLANGFKMKPNDKVMITKNDYTMDVYNGDIGFYLGKEKDLHLFEFEGKTIGLSTAQTVNSILPGYAMTVHKSQGSEYPVVILALTQTSRMLLERQMVFTAITRGKQKVIIVGENSALTRAIRNTQGQSRATLLKENLARAFDQPLFTEIESPEENQDIEISF